MRKILGLIRKILRREHRPTKIVDEKHIYSRDKHSISKTDISENALKVLNRLNSAGYEAYLVGGSVRDLLLKKAPKDFDVATSATPNEVRKLFRNSRIIGRRFKLVHILFHREVIEVATFRGSEKNTELQKTNDKGMLVRDNVYGDVHDDAWRRDFSINALFYNIQDASIIDLTGGVKDIHDKKIRVIGDPKQRYQEDPVRMMRAIRFACKLGFDIEKDAYKSLFAMADSILHVSASRLFDEVAKLYQCGNAKQVHRFMLKTGLLTHLMPELKNMDADDFPMASLIQIALENTDRRIEQDKPVNPAFLLAVFLWFPMRRKQVELQSNQVPPLPALEQAMAYIMASQVKTISIPKRFNMAIREIWLLQYRFTKRQGKRPFHLLAHPRFRAAYDFLAIRALAGDEDMELADWWTKFQEVDESEQVSMIRACSDHDGPPKRRRRRRPSKSKQDN